jgi:hypothetical protein
MDKLQTKPKNTLFLKSSLSNLINVIVQKFNDEFKNVDIDSIKKDSNTILYLMEVIDECLITPSIINNKVASKVDKNDLLMNVFKRLFPNITESELADIQETVQFILDNKLIKSSTTWNKVKSVFSFFFKSFVSTPK